MNLFKSRWLFAMMILFFYSSVALAQTVQKVSLNLKHASLQELFSAIEKQTSYRFSYRDVAIDKAKDISVSQKEVPVQVVLNAILPGKQLQFHIASDKSIVISKALEIKSQQNAKKRQVTGIIKDESGETIIGASVLESGTTNGAITDMEGHFSLTVDDNAHLRIAYIGYTEAYVSVAGKSHLTILMKEDAEELEEVVVVGYGTQKKVNLTGAVATASAKDLQGKAITNALEGLQGVIPNFNINYASGDPGSTPELNIRGYESLNGGEPLIMIDGTQSDSYFLGRLSPEDIESISVLKDASSSAIYGARAAFGVVLVTTKNGARKTEKANVSFTSNVIFSTPTYLPKLTDTYTHAVTVNEALRNYGDPIRFKEEDVEKMRLYRMDPTRYPSEEMTANGEYYYWGSIDYIDESLNKTATRWRNNVNISGGTELMNYYVSGGYTSDEGFFKHSNQNINIFNVKAKINANITKWWTVGANIDYVKDKQSYPHKHNPNSWWDFIYSQRRYFNIVNPLNGHYTNNVVAYLKEGSRDSSEETNQIMSFDTKVTPLKNWNIYGKYTYREYSVNTKQVSNKMTFSDNYGYSFPQDALWNGWASTSYVYHKAVASTRNTFDVYSDYETRFAKDHYVKAMVGFNQDEYWRHQFTAEREDMINDNVPSMNLTNGEDYVGQEEYSWATRSGFYRLNYNFKDRYLLETSGRYDGSSRFPKSSRFGFFPSASLGWRISEESFMSWSRKYLDNLKARVSYGSLGNQDVSTYAYIASMKADKVAYLLGGKRPIGIYPPGLVSDELTWEKVNSLNFAIDFALFNNRLSGSFDYYQRRTLDMLTTGDAMPGILGAKAPERNSADLCTKGWELVLNWSDHIGKVSYNVGFSLFDSKTHITKFDNPTGTLEKTHYVGEEIGEIWGYETQGFIDTAEKRDYINSNGTQQFFYNGNWKLGDIQYRDINADGKVDRGAYTVTDHGDLKIIGNSEARYNYGINLSAGWKGITVSAFFQGVGKRDFVPSGFLFWPYYSSWSNIQEHQLDTWTPENTGAYYPQMEASADRNYEKQTKYLQDASYIRLKNLSIGYQLPKPWLRKTFIESASITLSGRNLWEHSDLIKPYDPEGNAGDGKIFPFKREYAIGISLNF